MAVALLATWTASWAVQASSLQQFLEVKSGTMEGRARCACLRAQLFGEGEYDGEADDYEDALARYEALGLFDEELPGLMGESLSPNVADDKDDDTTPQMMLNMSMRRIEELTSQHNSSSELMQAAVAAAIDAAALVEATRGSNASINVRNQRL